MPMNSEKPWSELGPPRVGELSARRADPEHPFGFFYALNAGGQAMLVLQLASPVPDGIQPPRLKGVRVQWIDKTHSLQLALENSQDLDVFALLCRDLISCTVSAQSELECIDRLCARLIKWQRLLSKGGPRLLGPHEIRGLYAELCFLRRELLPRFGPDAVSAWKGPSGLPQDFAADSKVFEVKSHLVGSQQSVKISSPSQLWVDGSALYLCLYHLTEVAAGGQSLGALVDELMIEINLSAYASEEFEEKLESVGYLDLPEYRAYELVVVKQDFFAVNDEFPRINPSLLRPGIHEVSYSIQHAALSAFHAAISWSETEHE